MTSFVGGRRIFWAAAGAAVVVAFIVTAGTHDAVLAQGSPFGAPRPPAGGASAPGPDGIIGWLLAKQAEFYRGLSGMIRAAKTDGSAVWGLFGLSFAYGIFHAAGPGHGKAVISSYLVANEETWRRGVVLSFASALLQALVAVLIVGIAAALLNATRETMCKTQDWIEIASYALIALMGARLTWVKGRSFLGALRAKPVAHDSAAHEHHDHDHHGHDHDHGHHQHDHHGHHHHDHAGHDHAHAAAGHSHTHSHHHGHDHDDHSGHSHGPEPQELAGPGGWQRGLTAIIAVGLRPCSGAILVLVFALAQGLFWAGVASTFIMGLGTAITVTAIAVLAVGAKGLARKLAAHKAGAGSIFIRGVEVAAAVVVLVFGVALLAGYMVSERLVGVC